MNFDADTEEFLSALKPSTRKVYSHGLSAFQEFYAPFGTIKDFLDLVEQDSLKTRKEKTRVARNTLKLFTSWLQEKGYTPKTVRAYITAVQSVARYFGLTVSTRYVNVPASIPVSRKYPWTTEEFVRFLGYIKKPMYRAMATVIFQSGISLIDLLSLRYRDIQQEYESDVTPLCLDLVRIKTKMPYMTFVGSWGVSMLKEYLTDSPQPDEPVFKVSASAVERYFQRLGRRFVGEYEGHNPVRVHSLRSAFYTILRDHKVDPIYVEFWMGHGKSVPEQQRVYVSKSREGWRQTYREQAEPWLQP